MRSLSLILIFCGTLAAFGDEPKDFQLANTAYTEGRFTDARNAYQKIVEQGDFSANLFYNLGNTWLRLENPGQAVLAWERALTLNPGHTEAQANLLRVQQSTGARVPVEPAWTRYYPVLGAGSYVWIATIAAWTLLFALTARLFGLCRSRLAYVVAAGSAALGLLCAPMLQRQIWLEKAAVVIGKATTARSAPTGSAVASANLPPGSLVRLLAIRGDWAYAETPDAEKLWIPSRDLARVRL